MLNSSENAAYVDGEPKIDDDDGKAVPIPDYDKVQTVIVRHLAVGYKMLSMLYCVKD